MVPLLDGIVLNILETTWWSFDPILNTVHPEREVLVRTRSTLQWLNV